MVVRGFRWRSVPFVWVELTGMGLLTASRACIWCLICVYECFDVCAWFYLLKTFVFILINIKLGGRGYVSSSLNRFIWALVLLVWLLGLGLVVQ